MNPLSRRPSGMFTPPPKRRVCPAVKLALLSIATVGLWTVTLYLAYLSL